MFCLKNNRFFLSFISLLFIQSCASLKSTVLRHDIEKEIRKSPVFSSHATGFCLYDPTGVQYLARYNDDHYFVPASNTKILTTLACLSVQNDSLYTFKYHQSADSLFIQPLGDPSFLHPAFEDQTSLSFLIGKKVFFQMPPTRLAPFGSGWAWDDYPYSFQPELSWFPIYGNTVRIIKDSSLQITPLFFENFIDLKLGMKPGDQAYRERDHNVFRIWMQTDSSRFERVIPFVTSQELALQLLSDTLNTPVTEAPFTLDLKKKSPGIPLKPVLAEMMKESDNFLAEQLLIHAAAISDFEHVDEFRKSLVDQWTSFLPGEIRWVDGSGLSRYNLISPHSLVAVLDEIYQQKDIEFIKEVFPAGGVSGTLKNWYISENGAPYVYAKTGTLRHVHNLSGFLITKSGRVLIFSLMNNNFARPVKEVKKEMEQLLKTIHLSY